jgi:ABC-2 type transport system ATP-binding protein
VTAAFGAPVRVPTSLEAPVIETNGLGKRYGRRWALRDCTLTIPEGKVVGLVGPNGAGKTTLLHLAVGLLAPTAGSINVLGGLPADGPTQIGRVGFVAQETPVYSRLSIDKHLRMGAYLNPKWDNDFASSRIARLGLDPRQRAGSLSGGERAQLALCLAIAKRPDLLVLDEPVASLDPLARREFLQSLMEVVAAQGVSVVLSSHLVADLERVCDFLVVLVDSHVQVTGEVDQLLASHRRVSGPRRDPATLPKNQQVIEESHTDKQSVFLLRTDEPILDPSWSVKPVTLEDVVLAYMSQARDKAQPRRPEIGVLR